jgi:hypothetical protein
MEQTCREGQPPAVSGASFGCYNKKKENQGKQTSSLSRLGVWSEQGE